jgi:hypothetical protein
MPSSLIQTIHHLATLAWLIPVGLVAVFAVWMLLVTLASRAPRHHY